MFGRFIRLTARAANRVANTPAGVFLWHANRTCMRKQKQNRILGVKVANRSLKPVLMLESGRIAPKYLTYSENTVREINDQVDDTTTNDANAIVNTPLEWYDEETKWRPSDNYKVATSGFEIPPYVYAFIKHKYVILAIKVLIGAAILYLLACTLMAFVFVGIFYLIDGIKR
ncbi:hypothetical protein F-LCD7_0383 [Faustovirus]|nr:hypothetical protein F-LCD7_0383 [Faustovirus]